MDETSGEADYDEYDDDDPAGTSIRCSECQSEIYDDVDQCPACGHWILAHERYASTGLWSTGGIRIVAAIALAAFLGTIVLSILR